MAAEHLTSTPAGPDGRSGHDDQDPTLAAVRAVLAGTDLLDAAASHRVHPADLTDALDVFVAAGAAALGTQRDAKDWLQVRIEFADWNNAEQVAAAVLGPLLDQLEASGATAAWWFIRKAPCWRLRCQPGPGHTVADVRTALGAVLDSLVATGAVHRWWKTCYETETAAFGGPTGMDVAHRLFHADSAGVLAYFCRVTERSTPALPLPARRELSLLLCNALLSAAQLEWYERADVWDRVARMRPLPPTVPPPATILLAEDLNHLFSIDAAPTGGLYGPDKPLAFAADWAAAFHTAGHRLGTAATEGTLARGLRETLAYHVIFHWNRIGLAGRTQAILAHGARTAILGPPHIAPRDAAPSPAPQQRQQQ
jgi:thiopeptide-type bacteriocin biosynthesis protein